jgi:hypothetical protein
MRTMRFSILAIALAAACGTDTTIAPNADLVLSVSVSAGTISPTAPATITTTVTNAGRTTHTLQLNQCGQTFRVFTSGGASVALATLACALYSQTRDLLPGEQYSWTATWDGRNSQGAYVPGIYGVAGALLGAPIPDSPPVKVTLL